MVFDLFLKMLLDIMLLTASFIPVGFDNQLITRRIKESLKCARVFSFYEIRKELKSLERTLVKKMR